MSHSGYSGPTRSQASGLKSQGRVYQKSSAQSQFGNGTVMTSGTVVYGLDNDYGKSADGILKIFQIFFGLLGWALLAALPYHEEIFVQGHTGVFHAALAILVIVWLITIFTYIFRLAGWCSENKTVMQMIATKGLLVQNLICCILMIIGGVLLVNNCKKFDMGQNVFSYGYGGSRNSYNNDRSYDADQFQGADGFNMQDRGSCSGINMLSPYCMRYPMKCKQFADECIELARGGQSNKYYHTAIVSVVFIFLTAILYLLGAILICKKEGADWLPGGDEDGENDVSFNQFDLNQSLNRNSWKKSRNQSRAVEGSIVNGQPNGNSTLKSNHLI